MPVSLLLVKLGLLVFKLHLNMGEWLNGVQAELEMEEIFMSRVMLRDQRETSVKQERHLLFKIIGNTRWSTNSAYNIIMIQYSSYAGTSGVFDGPASFTEG